MRRRILACHSDRNQKRSSGAGGCVTSCHLDLLLLCCGVITRARHRLTRPLALPPPQPSIKIIGYWSGVSRFEQRVATDSDPDQLRVSNTTVRRAPRPGHRDACCRRVPPAPRDVGAAPPLPLRKRVPGAAAAAGARWRRHSVRSARSVHSPAALLCSAACSLCQTLERSHGASAPAGRH